MSNQNSNHTHQSCCTQYVRSDTRAGTHTHSTAHTCGDALPVGPAQRDPVACGCARRAGEMCQWGATGWCVCLCVCMCMSHLLRAPGIHVVKIVHFAHYARQAHPATSAVQPPAAPVTSAMSVACRLPSLAKASLAVCAPFGSQVVRGLRSVWKLFPTQGHVEVFFLHPAPSASASTSTSNNTSNNNSNTNNNNTY